ncbi:MAG: serine/threonine protein kinase [Akkermansiaceae bacterium]|nr:serine/threonine protein kinase [Akkermansiaceae bacterium]
MRTPDEREELLAELTEAYLERLRAGECLSVEEFAAAHPEVAQELQELLSPLVQMEELGKSARPAVHGNAHFPKTLGDYHLEEKIGSGGMGTVFRARQQSLHREVAVKILSPSWSADARHSEAFENESRLIAGLRHTNIVEVYGAGQEGPWRYYVMGLVRGQGVRAGNLPRVFPGVPYEQAVARVGLQAAKALAFAHAHGVLHRDVKPGNLLLDDAGVLHVSDFGLATVLNAGEEAPLVTQTHDGTLRYMAPERLLRGENSFAGDQYGLGLTLYELVTRQPVFREAEPGKLVHRICSDPLPPLRHAGELGAIINKSISFEPSERYPSMAAMAEDLQRFLNGEPVHARPASCWRRYLMWMRRRPAVAAWSHAAALLLVLLFVSMSVGYARVHASLRNENEQRLLAEKNAQIADASLQRIFSSMTSQGEGDDEFLPPSRADARLIQDLMPYYEQIAAQADSDDEKMAEACRILATIALQTGDYATSETYFRREAELLPGDSLACVQAMNGWAAASYAQERPGALSARVAEVNAELLRMVERLEAEASPELLAELVHSLQLAALHSQWCTCGEQTSCTHSTPGRGVLLARAVRLLNRLLEREPNSPRARLRQAELLGSLRSPEMRRELAPTGQSPQQMLAALLQEYPAEEEYQRAYLRLCLRQRAGANRMEHMRRAVELAQKLLAANPGDSEAIMLFFVLRSRYADLLREANRADEAAKEEERTLGVLSFLTSRADFPADVREKLVMLLARHSALRAEEPDHREAELRTLLRNYDESRIQVLRVRMKKLRHEMEQRQRRRQRGESSGRPLPPRSGRRVRPSNVVP